MLLSANGRKPFAVTPNRYVPTGSTRNRNVPSGADVVSWVKFVAAFVTTTFAPATTPCERSCTTPKIDPVTSARNRAAVVSVIKTIKIERKIRKWCLLIEHPPLGAELMTKFSGSQVAQTA